MEFLPTDKEERLEGDERVEESNSEVGKNRYALLPFQAVQLQHITFLVINVSQNSSSFSDPPTYPLSGLEMIEAVYYGANIPEHVIITQLNQEHTREVRR